MGSDPAVVAEAAAPTAVRLLAGSLSLTAKAWSTIKRAGVCACCAARLAGCRDPAVYACNERHLRVQLDSRFLNSAAGTGTGNGNFDGGDGGGGGALPNGARERCCPLCLGLLQAEVPLRMAPRPRRSSELHGDHNRACEQTGGAAVVPQPPQLPEAIDKKDSPCVADTGEHGQIPKSDGAADSTVADHIVSAAIAPVNGDGGGSDTPACGKYRGAGYSRARVAEAIAECIASRGYTVTSFGITAAVPACLVLRDAAFLEAGCGLWPVATTTASLPPPATTTAAETAQPSSEESNLSTASLSMPPPATAPPPVVPVKEALKIGLARALQDRLQAASVRAAGATAKAPAVVIASDLDSDFLVEVTAKAPEADAHGMNALLGGSAPSRPAGGKPHAWRNGGGGRWAKKRQRREEQRNPGLTVGAVKKGLATLDDAGRERMRGWVEGLLQGGETAERAGGDGSTVGGGIVLDNEEASDGEAAGKTHRKAAGAAVDGNGVVGAKPEGEDQEGGVAAADGEKPGEISEAVDADSGVGVASTATEGVEQPCSDPRSGNKPGSAITPADSSGSNPGMEALCEVAVRRHSIHFWGRYTKNSRSVPQTPWIRGFYSVQEAVSEPFEAFSGCVEGLLHGAGREDVDVRMLGRGRPFCLELVDSLRSADEVAARLPALEAAVNSAGGARNADGGVAVSGLRPAGPGELPCDVQAVGEGKRKHYRCVVWVSRAVREEEVLRMVADAPEELVVQQATPIRVLHRRTLLDRPRSIFGMRAEWINEHFFQLDLTTSAGERERERGSRCATPRRLSVRLRAARVQRCVLYTHTTLPFFHVQALAKGLAACLVDFAAVQSASATCRLLLLRLRLRVLCRDSFSSPWFRNGIVRSR